MQFRHSLIILAIAGLSACNGEKNKITVDGNIANMPEQTVYMEEININDMVLVDSAKTDNKGSFTLSATAPEPGLYRIRFAQEKFLLLSLDKGTAKVTADWNTLENYKVEGSAPSESLRKFLFTVREHLRDFNTISVVMDSMKARGNDSMLLRAREEAQDMNVQFTRFIELYADTTKFLPNAAFAAQMLNPQAEKEFLEMFVANINNKFPETKLAKDFTVKYNQILAMQNQVEQSRPVGPMVGTAAPDLALPAPDGAQVSLASFKGKYVLVDFWASWCRPCRQENPNVVAAYNKYKSKNFTVLGVSLDTDKDKWVQAITKDNLTWAHMSDLQGWESIAARTYAVEAIPTNFLVGPDGSIIARDLRGEALEAKLAEVLK